MQSKRTRKIQTETISNPVTDFKKPRGRPKNAKEYPENSVYTGGSFDIREEEEPIFLPRGKKAEEAKEEQRPKANFETQPITNFISPMHMQTVYDNNTYSTAEAVNMNALKMLGF